MSNSLKEIFAIDVRSVTLFRIFLGLFSLVDLIRRSLDLTAHYTDSGILPRDILNRLPIEFSTWSIHAWSGDPKFEVLLFLLAGISAICLVLGYRTRIAVVFLWLLTLSLQHRNPLVLYGVDDLLRLLLFWSCFLPFDNHSYSFVVRRITKPRREKLYSIAGVAILLQMAAMYLFSGIHKINSVEWRSGNALSIILNIDELTTSFGGWLQSFHFLMKFSTYVVIAIECLFPFMLFLPHRKQIWRLLALAGFAAMHVGIILCMNLFLFPYLCLIGLLPFLPSEFWRALTKRLKAFSNLVQSDPAISIDGRHWTKPVVALLITYSFAWNILSVSYCLHQLPQSLREVSQGFGLAQSWRLFSPPLGDGKWLTIEGLTLSGKRVDVWNNLATPASFGPPVDFMKHYRNDRWGSYIRGPFDGEWEILREPLNTFLCNQWETKNGELLKRLSVFLTVHPTQENGEKSLPETTKLWVSECPTLQHATE